MPEGTKLSQQLQALLDTAETLNSKSDHINTLLKAVEDTLVKANIGLEVWLDSSAHHELRRENPRQTEVNGKAICWDVAELGFARLLDGWHLAIRMGTITEVPRDGYPGETDIVSTTYGEPGWLQLSQASRQIRI